MRGWTAVSLRGQQLVWSPRGWGGVTAVTALHRSVTLGFFPVLSMVIFSVLGIYIYDTHTGA